MNRLTKLFCGLFSLSLASLTSAAITPLYQTTSMDGSDFRWTYGVSIGAGVRVQTGDYFTIYDFGGLDGNAEMPAGWSYSTADVGPVPFLLAPADDSTVANVTFKYTGASLVGPADLGAFSVDSAGDSPVTTAWASSSTRDGGNQDGQFASDMGSTLAPEQITNPNIPEPAAALIGIGLIGACQMRRRA